MTGQPRDSQGTAKGASGMMTSLPVIPGHERFVHPASYLRRPRGQSQPMAPAKAESAVERDQRIGLVSWPILALEMRMCCFSCSPHTPAHHPSMLMLTQPDSRAATHSRLSQGSHQLRCFALELPPHHLRYRVAGQEQSHDSDPKW